MFENIVNFFKRFGKNEKENSKNTAKERLHLVLAQDRANISADFLEMMKQEIIDVIKKYIDIDEEAIDVRMTNKPGEDGVVGAPALYANIPIVTIKNEARKLEGKIQSEKKEISGEKKIENNINQEVTENKIEDDQKGETTNNKEKEQENINEEKRQEVKEESKEVKENTNNKKTNTNKKNSNTKGKSKKQKSNKKRG